MHIPADGARAASSPTGSGDPRTTATPVTPQPAPTSAPQPVPTPAPSGTPLEDPPFAIRHIGVTSPEDLAAALSPVGVDTPEDLMRATLPDTIDEAAPPAPGTPVAAPSASPAPGTTAPTPAPGTPPFAAPRPLPPAATESETLAELRAIAALNTPMRQMIGQGFSDTVTPAVIRRNILENPAWYTAYTPYQPEISQGRLEALMLFQTMVSDLTALPIAGASLLDESSAAAEALLLMHRANRPVTRAHPDAPVLVDADVFPQTLAVIRGRARAAGIPVQVVDLSAGPDALPDTPVVGVVVQNPGDSGALRDWAPMIAAAHDRGALVAVVADVLSLTVVTPPGEMGADIAVGSTQRFGVPLFFGGPHAAYMAVTDKLTRQLPGRLVGLSHDDAGTPALRLALSTREQHIRREKATSNICTAQALLAVVAAMFAVHHGPDGLRTIAHRTHAHAVRLADGLRASGIAPVHDVVFDTVRFRTADEGVADSVLDGARRAGINLRRVDGTTVSVSTDETTTDEDVDAVLGAVGRALGVDLPVSVPDAGAASVPASETTFGNLARTSDFLTHPTFHRHRSETSMMRYLRKLADRDLALDRTMIPLGSCTMKLNAAASMEPISWPAFAGIHPFAPADQARGWAKLIDDLEAWLADLTGYAAVTLQPNSGATGEYTGLQAIRAWHDSRGDTQRRICLIPASAHGTNAASAALAGLTVVDVATAADGTIDQADLARLLAEDGDRVAAIMITYPSTHGVYEEGVRRVCAAVHDAGGQVYIDGANLNALVGWARPGHFGGDVSHLNLHKTFTIPHGGGGPGVGPVAAAAHLAPFLPGAQGAPVAAAPFGSAGVLPIPWAYLRMMGEAGLARATAGAVTAANHLARRLTGDFPVLYTGEGGWVAHECILDLRGLTHDSGITAEDVAKRLIDYGFHAPTLSFPVAGTLMVEPTESEDLAELDRFVAAMHAIRAEIQEVIDGKVGAEDSALRHAPHTASVLVGDDWEHPYPRATAGFPTGVARDKYFPPVGRIDGAFGDRHLVARLDDAEEL